MAPNIIAIPAAVVTNHPAASRKNTAGPVVGKCVAHDQAITAIAIAIDGRGPRSAFGADGEAGYRGAQHE
jgi:hypothetical protein